MDRQRYFQRHPLLSAVQMIDLHHFLQHRLWRGGNDRLRCEDAARRDQAIHHDAFNQIGRHVQAQDPLLRGSDAVTAAAQTAAVQILLVVFNPAFFLQLIENFADGRNRQL
ncbi:hypothetical protein D3C71_1769610 [compost metagenome]